MKVSGEREMENIILPFIKKHKLLHSGARVLVGVSGGPDSMALLYLLKKLRKEWDLDLQVLSVNHGLRGDASKGDFLYVKNIAADYGLPFHGATFDVDAYATKNRVSIEVAARELRYQFFKEKINTLQADYLALGHHGDDQVETLVMKLARTASSTAFSGIPVTRPLGEGKIVRPLLAVTKETIEAYCETNGITPRIDATNLETEHTRNYYRHYVVPLLKGKNANIHQTAEHLSETLAEDEAYLQQEAKKALNQSTTFHHEGKNITLDINLFKKHDQPLQRRAFHLILNYLYETLPNQLSYVHEEQFLDLIGERSGNRRLDFPQDLTLNRAYDKLSIYFKPDFPQEESFLKTLAIPGVTNLPDGTAIKITYTTTRGKESPNSFYIAIEELTYPLHVRTRKNGDRMSWKGLQGTKKLKDIFIDAKIPLKQRASWPLIVDDEGRILWLIGLKKGKRSEVNAKQFLLIQIEKGNQ